MIDRSSLPKRRNPRLKAYDYSEPAYYFVTICTDGRRCLFGDIRDSSMVPNRIGEKIENAWMSLPHRFSRIQTDAFALLPNHMHGLIFIESHGPALSAIVGAFKSLSANAARLQRLWQRSFHDRIVRDERELNAIREYIAQNPLRWELDRNNPQNWGIPDENLEL